jgi:peptide/nickel transport system permease protein
VTEAAEEKGADVAVARRRPWVRSVLRRLVVFAVTVLVASFLVFLLVALLPGDVARATLGLGASDDQVEALRSQWGLDRPLLLRYAEWLGGFLTGDLGQSYVTGESVSSQVAPRLAVTAWLVGLSTPLALIVALVTGVIAAVGRRRWWGAVISGVSHLGLAIPAFFAATLLVLVFAVALGWLPATGYEPLFAGRGVDLAGWASHLVLPVAAIVIVQGSLLARYVRSSFIDVLTEDYYRTARAVGWTRWRAVFRHGLRNAATSLATVVGLQLASLLVGVILVEQVFALPGLGSLLIRAVSGKDLLVVQGVVMVLVVAVLLINLIVDLAYLAIDPRLRRQGETA